MRHNPMPALRALNAKFIHNFVTCDVKAHSAIIHERFVCIMDDSKLVERLGRFPLPVEVIPMARSHVARALVALGGQPEYRRGFTTDNGNVILDVHGLDIEDPKSLEARINQIAGVVSNGLFAMRPADVLLIGGGDGVRRIG